MTNNLPQFVTIASDGVPEYYLDHTLLSKARMCESRFVLEDIDLWGGRGLLPWPLKFGILIHNCMEEFYKAEMAGSLELDIWLQFCADSWRKDNLDAYIPLPQYKAVGGFPGFIALITQYFAFYKNQSNYLKPLALEVAFGKNKEVPLLEDHTLYKWAPFRLYLAGRCDYIFDDGRRIGALDHKTFSMAGKNPMTTYEVQEGMTGYIYAMQYIYKQLKADLEKANGPEFKFERETNVLWLNFILTKSEEDLNKKFQSAVIQDSDAIRRVQDTADKHRSKDSPDCF
jgi:hypothetical protein